MFSRSVTIAAMLVLLPAALEAQRRQRGVPDANWDELTRVDGPRISGADLEKAQPLRLLASKKKDLKLTEEQATKLKEMETSWLEKNRPLLKAVDSLRGVLRNLSQAKSVDDQTKRTLARTELQDIVRLVRARYDSSATTALPLLDESQQTTAAALLMKHWEETDDMIRERMGGGGGGGGAAAPGRRRP